MDHLKLSNIGIIDVKLGDLNKSSQMSSISSQSLSSSTSLTNLVYLNDIADNLSYLSPEILKNISTYNVKSDVW